MDKIKRIISNGGPLKEDYEELREFISELDKLSDAEEAELLDLISPALCVETMQGFAFKKPHGYAGDHEIIDKIYTHWHSHDPDLRKWDEFFHSQEAPIAVRNRKQYFINLLDKIEQSSNRAIEQSLRVLNIGSGPARDVKEYLDARQDSKAIFDCIELDENAILYAKKLCLQHIDRITFINKNAFRFRTNDKYNLIWSAGLFDYFNDKQFIKLVSRLMEYLTDGGELVIGNFSTNNPSKNYMEKFGQWFLNHRNADTLIELAERAGASKSNIRVCSEEIGVNLFLHISNT